MGGRSSEPSVPPVTGIEVYVQPTVTSIKRVAVMPFRAHTEMVGVTVADLFLNELMRTGRYFMLERSQLGSILNEAEIALAGISDSRAIELGQMLGADGVVIGSVDEYGMIEGNRQKKVASVGLSVRMIDCASGQVMWSASYAAASRDSAVSLSQHVRAVVRGVVLALSKKWSVQKYKPAAVSPDAAINDPVMRKRESTHPAPASVF